MKELCGAGGRPFEVIAGAPRDAFGVRITYEAPRASAELARAAGIDRHPWGVPAWIGVRLSSTGALSFKPYHQLDRLDDRFVLPRNLPAPLVPVMASLDGDETELYLRLDAEMRWPRFADAVARLIDAPTPACGIEPTPVRLGFCVSLKWHASALHTVTLFADHRCLPPDEDIRRVWRSALSPDDAAAYDNAYMAARSTGPRPWQGWHAMLAWSLDRGGDTRRAVSLFVSPGRDSCRPALPRAVPA
jgi:hypothetical protein